MQTDAQRLDKGTPAGCQMNPDHCAGRISTLLRHCLHDARAQQGLNRGADPLGHLPPRHAPAKLMSWLTFRDSKSGSCALAATHAGTDDDRVVGGAQDRRHSGLLAAFALGWLLSSA